MKILLCSLLLATLAGCQDLYPDSDRYAAVFEQCYHALPPQLTPRQRWLSLQNCQKLAEDASRKIVGDNAG